jgi:hypothetical protein
MQRGQRQQPAAAAAEAADSLLVWEVVAPSVESARITIPNGASGEVVPGSEDQMARLHTNS